MASIVSVVVHPNRIFREGLARILAKSPFKPAFTASSTEDVPSTISGAGEQVIVIIGVREDRNLAEAVRATKASYPDAHVVVIGDAHPGNVTIALELGATSFVDENIDTPSLLKELELVTLGEPVISVFIFKQMLGHCSGPVSQQAAASPAVGEAQLTETQWRDTQGLVESKLQLSAGRLQYSVGSCRVRRTR